MGTVSHTFGSVAIFGLFQDDFPNDLTASIVPFKRPQWSQATSNPTQP